MKLSIRPLNKLTHQHYELLLDADPSEGVINNYMQRAVSFEAVNNNELLGIVVLLPTRPETLEIVNISVTATKRNNGIGRQLLTFAEKYARENKYAWLEIGTGSTSFGQLYLYQKCGFRVVGVDLDFFTTHYEEEIIENHLILRDMIRLRKFLK